MAVSNLDRDTLRKITSTEFSDIVTGKSKNTLEYSSFYEEGFLTIGIGQGQTIVFKNCLIAQDCKYLRVHSALKCNYYFENCVFSADLEWSDVVIEILHFNNCEVNSLQLGIGQGDGLIYISGDVNSGVKYRKCQLDTIRIEGNSKFNKIGIGFNTKIQSFEIREGEINRLTITNSADIKSLCFGPNFFSDDASSRSLWYAGAKNLKIFYCAIQNSTVGLAKFSAGILQNIEFIGSIISGIILNGSEVNKIKIEGSVVDGLTLKDDLILKYFEGINIIIETLHFNSKFLSFFRIDSSFIQNLSFQGVLGKESTFFVSNCCLNTLQFRNFINGGFINFSYTKLLEEKVNPSKENLTILLKVSKLGTTNISKVFLNTKNIEDFQRKNEKSLLKIENSNLGRSEFAGCNFTNAIFSYKDSKITEIFLTSDTLLPEVIKGSESQKRYLYTQLKKVYDQQGDQVNSNIQFAKEMNYYIESLSWGSNFWEKLRLSLNQFSNNHGQSWEQALGVTLGIGYLLFAIYGTVLLFSQKVNDPIIFKQSPFLFFIEFINPIHKANFMVNEEKYLNGWVLTSDGISRIIMAYLVYQLVQAFRKQGKN